MRIAALILLSAALALPAQGQPAPKPAPDNDIIGSLLDPHHKASPLEEEEPDTAGQRQTRAGPDVVSTPQGGRGGGAAVTYAPAPRSQRDQPAVAPRGDQPPPVRQLAGVPRRRLGHWLSVLSVDFAWLRVCDVPGRAHRAA